MAELTPFPDWRIDEIIAEVAAAQIAAEDAAMLEKMAGLRCMSCECPLPVTLTTASKPANGSRRCGRCEGMVR